MQNRDLNQGKQEISHSSWTSHRCSFFECSHDLPCELCLQEVGDSEAGPRAWDSQPWHCSYWGWVILHPGGSPIHCKICGTISGFYTLMPGPKLEQPEMPGPRLEQLEMLPAIAIGPTGDKDTSS